MKKNILLVLASALMSLGTAQAAQNFTKCYGQNITLTTNKVGDKYEWYRNNQLQQTYTTNTPYTDTNLTSNTTYKCVVTTNGGSKSTNFLKSTDGTDYGNFEFPPSAATSWDQYNKTFQVRDEIRNETYTARIELKKFMQDGVCDAGESTTTKNPNNIKQDWFNSIEAYEGEYMLAVDGPQANAGEFSFFEVYDIRLNAGQEYEFSCFIINIDMKYEEAGRSLPQLQFRLEKNGRILKQGDLFTIDPDLNTWKPYDVKYTPTENLEGVKLIISNQTQGQAGNDFAIDKVYFGAIKNSATSSETEEFNVTVYDNPKLSFTTPEVCPGTSATINTTITAEHNGTLDTNINYTWKDNNNSIVGSSKDLTITAPTIVDIYEYELTADGEFCTASKSKGKINVIDCDNSETINHPTVTVCPNESVTLTCSENAPIPGITWSTGEKDTKTITVTSSSTKNESNPDQYSCTYKITDASGTTTTYTETFPVATKDCSGTEDSKTHQIKEGDTITLIIPENKRCDDCTYRWYRINENGESEEILGLDPKNPTYTPSSVKDGDKYYGEVIDNDNNVKHTQYLKIETYRETTYTVCYDVNNDAPQTKTITGAKADDEWYQWQWIKDGNPIEFPEGTITTEGENITFNLEYFVNDNNGTLPTEIHILEKYGVKTEPVEPNDPNSNGTTEPDGDIGGRARNFGINCDDFISEDGNLSYNSSTRILGDESKGSYIVIGSNYEYADEFPSKKAGMSKHKGVIRVTTQGMGNSTPDLSENSENTYFIEVDGGDVVGEVFSVHSNMKINRGEKYIFSLKARTTSIIEGILTDSPAELDFFIIINNNKQKLNTNTEIINHAAWQKYEYEYTAEEDAEGLIIMISDNNNKSDMNDFALDDMSFYQMQGGTVSERSAYRSLYRSATAQAEAEDEFNENGNQVYKDEFYLIINPVTYQFVEEAAAPSREYEAEVKLTHNANNEYLTFFYDPNISYVEGMTKYEDKKVATNLYGCPHEVYFTLNLIAIEPEIFFSPNEDGVNDRWMIKGIESAPNAHIMIYDRHSKLLYKSVGSEFTGWDGNYNGHGMVQDDYWYVIQIPETNETLSGHFILKR